MYNVIKYVLEYINSIWFNGILDPLDIEGTEIENDPKICFDFNPQFLCNH